VRRLAGLALLCGCITVASAQQPSPTLTYVSIVIDDLGNNRRAGERVINLRAPVALAILPHTPHAALLAEKAQLADKEILLHLPMDADGAEPGPGRIESQMPAREIAAMLAYNLESVPHALGVNNHMGSRLTQDKSSMDKLMRALAAHKKLFFLDSLTSPHSIATQAANEHGIATLRRDIFLDNERGADAVQRALDRVERLLAVRGRAVVIGHPHPETLDALERWLGTAAAKGIRVIPLSIMLQHDIPSLPHVKNTAAAGAGL
jgi:polysaccharide deacetylase 2 family uncharacterized protein YibQ